jgi:hypothetical protein
MKRATILLGLASLVIAQGAFASGSEAEQRYRSEKAACFNGSSNQDRATCLKEAGAAFAEAQRNHLSSGDPGRNSVARCEALPAADREDCKQRVEHGVTSGSVRDGGLLREYSRPAD